MRWVICGRYARITRAVPIYPNQWIDIVPPEGWLTHLESPQITFSHRMTSARLRGWGREWRPLSSVPAVVPVEQQNSTKSSEAHRNRNRPQCVADPAVMAADHSLPALPQSASQAGRRRFDPGRPLLLKSLLRDQPS